MSQQSNPLDAIADLKKVAADATLCVDAELNIMA